MKRIAFWVGILLSVVFLYIAVRGLNPQEVWSITRNIQWVWIIPGIVIYFASVLLRSKRWASLLRNERNFKPLELFQTISIGYLGNNVFPARAGEFIRAYHLQERFNIPFSTSFASIIVERIFDGLVMIAFILVGLPVFLNNAVENAILGNLQWIVLAGSVIFLIAFIILILFALFPNKMKKIINSIVLRIIPNKWHEKYESILNRFLAGLQSLKSPLQIFSIFIQSVIIWVFETGIYWCVQQAFGIAIPPLFLFLLTGVLNIVSAIPSAPGYIGVFDAPGISLLSAIGLSTDLAAAYILTLHAVLWLPVTVVGFLFFFKEGLTWSKIQAKKEEEVQ